MSSEEKTSFIKPEINERIGTLKPPDVYIETENMSFTVGEEAKLSCWIKKHEVVGCCKVDTRRHQADP